MEITSDIAKILAFELDIASLKSLKETSMHLSGILETALDTLAYKTMTEALIQLELRNYRDANWKYIYSYIATKGIEETLNSSNVTIVTIGLLSGIVPTESNIRLAIEKGNLTMLKMLLMCPKLRPKVLNCYMLVEYAISTSNIGIVNCLVTQLKLNDISHEAIVGLAKMTGDYSIMLNYLIDKEITSYADIAEYFSDNYIDVMYCGSGDQVAILSDLGLYLLFQSLSVTWILVSYCMYTL